MSYMDEFKEFIAKGNVMDMAVGVIIGGAFGNIVSALTEDIINPLITTLTGGGADMAGSLVVLGMDFGKFISAVINFLIIAFIVFNLVKASLLTERMPGGRSRDLPLFYRNRGTVPQSRLWERGTEHGEGGDGARCLTAPAPCPPCRASSPWPHRSAWRRDCSSTR